MNKAYKLIISDYPKELKILDEDDLLQSLIDNIGHVDVELSAIRRRLDRIEKEASIKNNENDEIKF
ncbi:MAG: hypothetical protein LUG60_04540 [Erysipelotrichaceae bacterium]|nr:hypothetical protein [Erysipelotrichaceae bacterium]